MKPGEAFQHWAQGHERLFLTLFLGAVVTTLTVMVISAAARGHAVAITGAWLAGFGLTALEMYRRHRAGRLILRRAEDRERQQQKSLASVPVGWALAGAFAVLLVVGGLVADLAAAVLAGTLTAIAPVLLRVAYALRPDEHLGEDL